MSNKLWLIRPLLNGSNQLETFLREEIVAVGYPIGESFEDCNTYDIRKLLKENDVEDGVSNVTMFVRHIKIGDKVIVPSVDRKYMYIGEVISDYFYDSTVDVDQAGFGYPHQRRVKWLLDEKPIMRSDLPETFKSSLRYPGAVAELTKHLPIVQRLLKGDSLEKDNTLNSLEQQAIAVVKEMLDSDNEAIRLQAAQIILSVQK